MFWPLAMEVPTEWLLMVGGSIAATFLAGVKAIWSHWQKREDSRDKDHAEKATRYKEIIDSRDALVAQKDLKIEEMGKKLSLKSDEHATKIETLQDKTITKVEEMGDKNLDLFERTLKSQNQLTTEVQNLQKLLEKVLSKKE